MLPQQPHPGPPVPPPRHRRPRVHRRAHPVAAALTAVLLGVVGLSYARALTYPGNASWEVRTVEWVRDHGGSGVVDIVENW